MLIQPIFYGLYVLILFSHLPSISLWWSLFLGSRSAPDQFRVKKQQINKKKQEGLVEHASRPPQNVQRPPNRVSLNPLRKTVDSYTQALFCFFPYLSPSISSTMVLWEVSRGYYCIADWRSWTRRRNRFCLLYLHSLSTNVMLRPVLDSVGSVLMWLGVWNREERRKAGEAVKERNVDR